MGFFEDLFDINGDGNLIKLFYDSSSKKALCPSIEFLPENSKDCRWVSNSKIKELCAALEHEYVVVY